MTNRDNPTEFTRRDFLVRASQVACALSLASPALSRFLSSAAYASSLHVTHESGPWRGAPTLNGISSGLKWRMLGPFRGGRVAAASGVPGRPNEFYFGAVNGGVWKSIDAGRVWTPVFDSQPVASIGAITIAPSSPTVIYVASGECTLRDSMGYGNGMYK